MKSSLRNQSGFSLIELMIVVAIIGILATIAVPNFNRFTGKAKQSEAKAALAAIYSGEKSFFAEWSQYYGDFRDIGYTPEGKFNYRIGFSAVGTAPVAGTGFVGSVAGGATAGACFNTTIASCGFTVNPTQSYTNAAIVAANTVTPTTAVFTAGAWANFKAAGTTVYDTWTINEVKTMSNVVDGL